MSAQQVLDAAQILFDEFGQMKLNDVVFCFNKAKRGHYGIIYDRLDVHVLLSWLHRFDADQTEQIEFYRQRNGNHVKRELKSVPLLPDSQEELRQIIHGPRVLIEKGTRMHGPHLPPPETAVNWFKKIREDIDNRKVKKKTPIAAVKVNDSTVSNWIAKFNILWNRQAKWHEKLKINGGGTRFVFKNGKRMDITEFLTHKQYQRQLAIDRA